MIEKAKFRAVVDEAFDVVSQFRRLTNDPPRSLLGNASTPSSSMRSQQAQYFAELVADAQVWPVTQPLGPGFSSWLYRMDDDRPAIVVDTHQLRNWFTSRTTHNVEVDVQMARGIVHEVGHVRLHSALLSGAPRNSYVPSASPQQENEAWIFAATVLGLALGDYSKDCKDSKNMDDAPGHPI